MKVKPTNDNHSFRMKVKPTNDIHSFRMKVKPTNEMLQKQQHSVIFTRNVHLKYIYRLKTSQQVLHNKNVSVRSHELRNFVPLVFQRPCLWLVDLFTAWNFNGTDLTGNSELNQLKLRTHWRSSLQSCQFYKNYCWNCLFSKLPKALFDVLLHDTSIRVY